MRFRRHRLVEPELMDDLPPEQTVASLRDIVRINELTGHHVLLKAFAQVARPDEQFRVLDVGAASGDAGAVLRRRYPRCSVTSLDYRAHHLRSAAGDRVAGDAFRLPFAAGSFDVVYSGLFLHHFSNEEVVELLRSMNGIARRAVIANDLERHVLPYYFLPATRPFFGWDPLTVHDGMISVQAGFNAAEMRSLASDAGLTSVRVQVHRPSFRIALVARKTDVTLSV